MYGLRAISIMPARSAPSAKILTRNRPAAGASPGSGRTTMLAAAGAATCPWGSPAGGYPLAEPLPVGGREVVRIGVTGVKLRIPPSRAVGLTTEGSIWPPIKYRQPGRPACSDGLGYTGNR